MTAAMPHHKHHHSSPFNLQSTPHCTDSARSGTGVLYVGILANVSLSLVKLACGHVLASKSLIADAWHGFSDLTTDLQVLFALLLTSAMQKRGFNRKLVKKVENLLSVLASGVLMATAVYLAWEGVETMMAELPLIADAPKNRHGHGSAPSLQGIWPAALTIVVKEWLYQEFMKVADGNKSVVLASNAVHQRADSLISIVAVVTILAGNVLGMTLWIDSVGSFFISVLIIKTAVENVSKSIRLLM